VRVIARAPNALVGLEVLPTPSGVAVGFATTHHEIGVVALDHTGETTVTALRAERGPVCRVLPTFTKDRETGNWASTPAVVSDCTSTVRRHRNAVILSGEARRMIEVENNGAIVVRGETRETTSPQDSEDRSGIELWRLGDGGGAEIEATQLDDGTTVVVAASREGAFLGMIDRDLHPMGSLEHVGGGGEARSPSIAANRTAAQVAWTERDAAGQSRLGGLVMLRDADNKWTTSALSMPDRDGVAEPSSDALFPSVAAVGDDRFLLSWVQDSSGPARSLRMVTLDDAGHRMGAISTLSSDLDAYWPRVAVGPSGHGSIAFFTPIDGGFALAAAPILCGKPQTSPVASAK
jgi:hypothetical protein